MLVSPSRKVLYLPFFTPIFFVHKKTVVAVLDHLVNPYWPYLPEKMKELGENSDRIERAWSSVPDDPVNYDFFYHVLDADDQGREPKLDERTLNELFNPKSMSFLRCIAESDDKVERRNAFKYPALLTGIFIL